MAAELNISIPFFIYFFIRSLEGDGCVYYTHLSCRIMILSLTNMYISHCSKPPSNCHLTSSLQVCTVYISFKFKDGKILQTGRIKCGKNLVWFGTAWAVFCTEDVGELRPGLGALYPPLEPRPRRVGNPVDAPVGPFLHRPRVFPCRHGHSTFFVYL